MSRLPPPRFADCRSCANWRPAARTEPRPCRGCGAGENFEPDDEDDEELHPFEDLRHGRGGESDEE